MVTRTTGQQAARSKSAQERERAKAARTSRTQLVRAEPLYRQLAATLREGIVSGEYPPGTLLPSESALMAEHAVSRPTVRDAFDVLASEGLIKTYNGRGRQVRPQGNAPARSLTRDIRSAEAFDPSGKPRRWRSPADPDIAALLGIPADEPTFVEERTHHHDQDQPAETTAPDAPADVALYTRILPFTVAEGTPLEQTPYPQRAELLAILAETYGPITWTEHVRARMPQPEEATALGVPEGTPILDVVRVATGTTRPVLAETERRNAETLALSYQLDDITPDTSLTATAVPTS
jgi:GntR family transcriptional regulator